MWIELKGQVLLFSQDTKISWDEHNQFSLYESWEYFACRPNTQKESAVVKTQVKVLKRSCVHCLQESWRCFRKMESEKFRVGSNFQWEPPGDHSLGKWTWIIIPWYVDVLRWLTLNTLSQYRNYLCLLPGENTESNSSLFLFHGPWNWNIFQVVCLWQYSMQNLEGNRLITLNGYLVR